MAQVASGFVDGLWLGSSATAMAARTVQLGLRTPCHEHRARAALLCSPFSYPAGRCHRHIADTRT